MIKEYALYKGDDFITLGTTQEIADWMGIKVETVKFYLSPAYKRRVQAKKKPQDAIILIEIEIDEEGQEIN